MTLRSPTATVKNTRALGVRGRERRGRPPIRRTTTRMPDHNDITRRELLSRAAAAAGSALLTPALAPARQPASAPATRRPVVYEIVGNNLVSGVHVHYGRLRRIIDYLIMHIADATSPAAGWNRLIAPDERILIKCNRSGSDEIATSWYFVRAVLRSMADADIEPHRIVLLEAPDPLYDMFSLPRPPFGWSATETDFASGSDRFHVALEEVSAIVNISFLKTHNLAGMTACLKNLSHGLVKHPARYHGNACAPYIGDIVACPAIGPRLRLHLLDALRVVYHGGPAVRERFVHPASRVLAATDGLALDTVALDLLNRIRRDHSLPPVGQAGSLPWLQAAQRRGQGVATLDRIDRRLATL